MAFRKGERVIYNDVIYTVINYEGDDALLVSRSGVILTIPASQSRKVMEEGKDTDINRFNKIIRG